MRKLKTTDLFAMSKILKKIGIKLEGNGKTQQQFGIDMFVAFLENMHMAEEEFNGFFASLLNITEKEFAELAIEDTFRAIEEFKNQEGLKLFLSMVSK